MNYNKYIVLALSLTTLTACSDIDDINPEGQYLTQDQKNASVEAIPSLVDADINGMYMMMAKPNTYFSSNRADDGGYFSVALSNDLNGSDVVGPNSGYNWFSVPSDYSDRSDTYANPRMRYGLFYNQIKAANDIITSIDSTTTDSTLMQSLGQAKACRAFSYMNLVPYYQFNYQTSADKPCVPLVTEKTTNFTENPRVAVKVIYNFILNDLTAAHDLLDGFKRTNKKYINQAVVSGLLARTYLAMGDYAKAADFAKQAIKESDAKPASIENVSVPAFCDAKEGNWMWGTLLDASDVADFSYSTASSQLSSFSGDSYTAGAGCYRDINSLLYKKIPATDIRKQWWVSPDMKTTLLDNQTWTTGSNVISGQKIIAGKISNIKEPFNAYTNVKFGMKSGIGNSTNNNDFPLMRIEEMYLIEAEALAMSGNLTEGKSVLENLIKTYRDPSYSVKATTAEAFQNEVWFQRRVELWGEGFSMWDIMRLNKPVVRIHGSDVGNWPDAFAFNIQAGDGYLLMRFPNKETNNNSAIVQNSDGKVPVSMQNPDLTDGVTD